MTTQHGRFTIITVATVDLSQWIKTSTLEKTPDVHDTTGYTSSGYKSKSGGLIDGKFTVSGTYDNTAGTGPRAVLNGIVGTTVPVTRKPEGTGTGKPLDTFNAVVGKYVETNPHDDMVTWSCDFEVTGAVVSTTQA